MFFLVSLITAHAESETVWDFTKNLCSLLDPCAPPGEVCLTILFSVPQHDDSSEQPYRARESYLRGCVPSVVSPDLPIHVDKIPSVFHLSHQCSFSRLCLHSGSLANISGKSFGDIYTVEPQDLSEDPNFDDLVRHSDDGEYHSGENSYIT